MDSLISITSWTGRTADALRQALRMSNEAFAEYLGVAVRTVAYWRARPDVVPRPALQDALDVALERAPEHAKIRFALIVSTDTKSQDFSSRLWHLAGVNDEETRRLQKIQQQPSRLDKSAIDTLAQVLASQRRLEDSVGPSVVLQPMTLQLEEVSRLLQESSGPHRDALEHLTAEWMSYVGWLHTAVRCDDKALKFFNSAVQLADDVGDGVIAATAISFRGYLARLQGRPKAVIRESMTALATPGSHITQQVYDRLQLAQGYADLGDNEKARRLLDDASDLVNSIGEPPPSIYWYTEPFFRLNIGLAQLAIGQYQDAVASLKSGLENIPSDQRNAEWLHEYRLALAYASERA